MRVVAADVVEHAARGFDLREDLVGPCAHRHGRAVARQLEPRLAPFHRHAAEIRIRLAIRIARERRALVERADEQVRVEKARGVERDARRLERIDVETAHLDVLNAARRKRVQRPLARIRDALRPDRRVELVLDLQHVRVDLNPLAVAVRADRLVRRIRLADRLRQRVEIAGQRVVVRLQRGLRGRVRVAEVAHPQARRVRAIQRRGVERVELVRSAAQEAGIERGRRAEQVHQQPARAAEIADQREVALGLVIDDARRRAFLRVQPPPHFLAQRIVVVNPRDALHRAAVAIREAAPVDGLQPPDVRRAVVRDRDFVVGRQQARHRIGPQHLVAERRVDVAMQLVEPLERRRRVALRRRDQLDERLRIIGRQRRMRERRAERARMRRKRDHPVARHAQAFLLDAAQAVRQLLARRARAQHGKALLQQVCLAGSHVVRH
ncbi:Uncharacterised protein [Burkholderia pseudomallei]|nr:Uncharacterised protein [Burkholderia pseudomallei]